MQYRAVGRRCTTGSATVLGDLAQGTTPWATASWAEALGHLGKPDAVVEELTAGFRVPTRGDRVRLPAAAAHRAGPDAGGVGPRERRASSAVRAVRRARTRRCVAACEELLRHEGSIGLIAADARIPALAEALTAAGIAVPLPRRGDDRRGPADPGPGVAGEGPGVRLRGPGRAAGGRRRRAGRTHGPAPPVRGPDPCGLGPDRDPRDRPAPRARLTGSAQPGPPSEPVRRPRTGQPAQAPPTRRRISPPRLAIPARPASRTARPGRRGVWERQPPGWDGYGRRGRTATPDPSTAPATAYRARRHRRRPAPGRAAPPMWKASMPAARSRGTWSRRRPPPTRIRGS